MNEKTKQGFVLPLPPMQVIAKKNHISPEAQAELEQLIEKWRDPHCYITLYPDYEAMWNALKRYRGINWDDVWIDGRTVAEIMEGIEQCHLIP